MVFDRTYTPIGRDSFRGNQAPPSIVLNLCFCGWQTCTPFAHCNRPPAQTLSPEDDSPSHRGASVVPPLDRER